jgi:hypothetical protein
MKTDSRVFTAPGSEPTACTPKSRPRTAGCRSSLYDRFGVREAAPPQLDVIVRSAAGPKQGDHVGLKHSETVIFISGLRSCGIQIGGLSALTCPISKPQTALTSGRRIDVADDSSCKARRPVHVRSSPQVSAAVPARTASTPLRAGSSDAEIKLSVVSAVPSAGLADASGARLNPNHAERAQADNMPPP